MRVQVLLELSDANRLYTAGEVCDLPDEIAARWMTAGWVVLVAAAPEAAALAAPPENATLPTAGKRPRAAA